MESAPATVARSLKRALSDAPAMDGDDARREEVDAERRETWTQTQQLRKKSAHVFSTRASTPSDWQKWLESTTVAHRFVGKAGEAHRVFVLSADTFGREATTHGGS